MTRWINSGILDETMIRHIASITSVIIEDGPKGRPEHIKQLQKSLDLARVNIEDVMQIGLRAINDMRRRESYARSAPEMPANDPVAARHVVFDSDLDDSVPF